MEKRDDGRSGTPTLLSKPWSQRGRFTKRWWLFVLFFIWVPILIWIGTKERLPREIRIATGKPGGLYYKFALALQAPLVEETGRSVRLIETNGSVENSELVKSGSADLAILEAGAVLMDDLAALAPLFPEVIHVIARRGRGIQTFRDLEEKKIVVAPKGSGMRESAMDILSHYRVESNRQQEDAVYFSDLAENENLDGAIVTAGLLNPDLQKLLGTGEFDLIPLLDAEALAIRHAHFFPFAIPRGFFSEGPPVPPQRVPTVATTAFLATHEDAEPILVKDTLGALYKNDLSWAFPMLVPFSEAAEWAVYPRHETARSYFAPFKGIDLLANFMESLAATKELLFALGAGLYLLWRRRGYLRERRIQQEVIEQKEVLDSFLEKTFEIEKKQMHEKDPERLSGYLDDLTRVKLKALEELTHEELRADNTFLIFLTQCGNLSRKIESRLAQCSGSGPP